MASETDSPEEAVSPVTDSSSQELENQNDYPLALLYRYGYDFFQRVERGELPRTEPEATDSMREGCDWLNRCLDRIDQLGIFSANEELEDVATADLKYLLVPWMLAELLQRQMTGSRLQALRAARLHLSAFIGRCEQLGLLPEGERAAMAREEPADAATRRAEKIARFNRQKEAKAKLDEYKRLREEQKKQRLRRRTVDGELTNGSVEDGEEEEGGDYEQDERQAQLVEVELAIGQAMDTLDGLLREETMIAAVEEARKTQGENGPLSQSRLDQRHRMAENFHRTAQRNAVNREIPVRAPISCATFAQDVIEGRADQSQPHTHRLPTVGFGPVSLMGGPRSQTNRQRLQAQVFQPSHSIPRMSIEQAGDVEVAMMNAVTKRNEELVMEATVANAANGSYEGDQEEGEDEASEYKARAWDDWTDEHPRGQGNSKLTPCG